MNSRFLFRGKRLDNGKWVHTVWPLENADDIEIIGNIHDTPELLQELAK